MNKKSLLLLIPFAAAALAGCTPAAKPCDQVGITFKQASMTLGINDQQALPYEIEGGSCSGELKFEVATPDVAKVDFVDGVYKVTGLKEGNTEITCNGKTFTVYVEKNPDPTKEVVEVLGVKSAPTSIGVGKTIALDSVTLNVKLSDGTESTVHPTVIECDTSVAADSVEATAKYKEVGSAKFNIKVVDSPTPVGEGAVYTFKNEKTETQNMNDWTSDQFMDHLELQGAQVITGMKDVTNAYIGGNGGNGETAWNIWNCLKVGKSGAKGQITLTLDTSATFKSIKVSAIGNRDDGELTINGITKAVNKKAAVGNLDPIELEFDIAGGVSDLVISTKEAESGNYAISITRLEFVKGDTPTPQKELKSIAISGEATKTSYQVGETYSSQGLSVVASYTDGTSGTVSATITPDKATAALGDTSVTFTASFGGKQATKEVAVTVVPQKEVKSIEISGTLAKTTYNVGEAYSSEGLSVVATYTDGTSGTVSATITPDKTTAALGDTSVTFTASFGGKQTTKAFDVKVNGTPTPTTVNVEYSFSALEEDNNNEYDADEALAAFTAGKTLGDAIVTAVEPTKVYPGAGALKVGSGSNGGSLEITTSTNVTQVVITAHAYAGSRVELNNISIGSKTITVEKDAKEFVFPVSATKSIEINTSKRVLIDKIGFVAESVTPQKDVKSIAITGEAKTTYNVGEAYSSQGLSVVATYTDNSTGTVSATITPDKTTAALGDTSVTFTASFGGQTATKVVNVTLNTPTPVGEGNVYVFNNTFGEVKNFSGIDEAAFLKTLVTKGANIIKGYKDASNAYIGGNGGNSDDGSDWTLLNCLKIGKSKAKGTITLKLDSTIAYSSIKVKAIGSRDDGELTINGVTKPISKKGIKTDLEPIEVEFNIASGASELVLSSKDATQNNYGIMITSIEFVGGGQQKVVTGLNLESKPSTLEYMVGDSLNLAGMVVKATYSTGETEDVTRSVTVSPMQLNTAGDSVAIDVSFGGQHTSFNVKVTARTLESIYINVDGMNKTYTEGQTISLDGVKVFGKYNVGNDAELAAGSYQISCNPTVASKTSPSTTITATATGVENATLDVQLTVTDAPIVTDFVKATSIAIGDKVAFVCESAKTEMTGISTSKTKYGEGTAYVDKIAHTYEMEVVAGSASGSFAFKVGNNYINWESGNSLNCTGTKVEAASSWTVAFDSNGNATITNVNDSTRTILWNVSSPRFAAYAGQKIGTSYNAVQIYKAPSAPVDPAVLTGITVSENHRSFYLGGTFVKETVTASYDKGNPVDVTDKAVFSAVNMNLPGDQTVEVSYTEGGVTKNTSYTINISSESAPHVDVTGVSLNKPALTLNEGATETLVATVAPSDATVQTVSWESDDESVVTVVNGVVTAVSEGTATITVTTTEGGKTAICVVTVNEKTAEKGTEDNPFTPAEAKVEALKLTETTDSKNPILSAKKYYIKGTVGEMAETFNPTYGNYSFWYEGKDFEVWRIKNGSNQAMFTGGEIQVGDEVTIYGSIMNYKGTAESATDAYVTNITRPVVAVTGVSFDPTEITIGVGGDATLSPVVAPANASNKSCNFEIVSGSDKVSLVGAKVTGVAEGDAVIKATTVDGGFAANITIHVSGEAPEPAKEYSLTYTTKDDPTGLTSSPAAGNFESSGSARAAQWSNNEGLTLTTDSYTGVTKIVLTTSTNSNNDAYEISCTVGGNAFGETISMQKGNNMELIFEDDAATGVIVITYTLKNTKKSIYVKSIVITAQ